MRDTDSTTDVSNCKKRRVPDPVNLAARVEIGNRKMEIGNKGNGEQDDSAVFSLTVAPQCTPAVARACQLASGPLVDAADYWAAMGALSLRLDETPAPSSAADALGAVQVLSRFTARLAVAAHAAMHSPADAPRCSFNVEACRTSVDLAPERATAWRPGTEFAAWLNRFRRESERCHGARLSERAKRLIAAEFRKTVTTAALARTLGCSVPVLVREFARRLNSTPLKYRTRVRVAHALRALRDTSDSVDAIACDVGWKGRKDLYRAVRTVTGMTVTEVRRCSDEAFEALLACL